MDVFKWIRFKFGATKISILQNYGEIRSLKRSNGSKSAEQFREAILEPLLNEKRFISVLLDDPHVEESSCLMEIFGKLKNKYSIKFLDNHVKIIGRTQFISEEAMKYMIDRSLII